MSEYIVSARKYRPVKFSDMVGQEHISSTLQNAIKTGHLAHAFLFCGPRGVGKTTAARILAKTINCENLSAETEACDHCQSCVSFNQNSSFTIQELDAASNNSVEDIRQLVEQVRFAPQSGKYKIYIIDEVHMLSSGAFNAFLKTLEEPPSYCKFILATTEKHKILPTILSRCQVFDFRRIKIETIVAHLKNICKLENIDAEEDALHIIAQKCDGGMRDALSMFDRLSSYSGGKLTYSSVLENLNVLDYDYFFKVTDALLAEDLSKTMLLADEILKKGFEGDDFMLGLSDHFRNLLFCKNQDTLALMEISDNLKFLYQEQTNVVNANYLINALQVTNQFDIQYKSAKNKRLTLEISLVRLCFLNSFLANTQEVSKKKITKLDAETVATPTVATPPTKINTTNSSAAPVTAPPPVPRPDKAVIISKEKDFLSVNIDEIANATFVKKEENTPIVEEPKEMVVAPVLQDIAADDLQNEWIKYKTQIPEDKSGISALLLGFEPNFTTNKCSFSVNSIFQKSQLQYVENTFAAYVLKNKNAAITVEISVDKTEDTNASRLYLPKAIFKKMIETNPDLIRLKNELGLDFDYS